MKPIIGLSLNTSPPGDKKRTFSKSVELLFIQRSYLDFIEAGGGTPLLLPILKENDNVEEIVRRLDGIVVSGGIDLDPSFYGEENKGSEGFNLMRDLSEAAYIREGRRQEMPVLGICRGFQVMNVVFGGDLFQDLPTQVPGAMKHHRDAGEPENYHRASLTGDSILGELFDSREFRVNSSHHQALHHVGDGLEVIARATDDVIEAVVCREDPCTLGIQWHPERMLDDANQVRLAKWFIEQTIQIS